MIYELLIIDFLTFDESFTPNIKTVAFGDVLEFSESMSTNVSSSAISDTLAFVDRMDVTKIIHLGWADTLTFVESTLPRVTYLAMSDILAFVEDMRLSDGHYAKDILEYTEVWTVEVIRHYVRDTLDFTDAMTYSQSRGLNTSDTLVFSDYMSATLAKCPCPTVPEQPHQVTFAVGSDIVILPMPKFGNSNTLLIKRINRVSRGNDLIVAGVPGWNSTRMQRYEWDYLTKDQAEAIFNFMKRYHGIPVAVTGVYSEIKNVILLKPDAELSQIGIDNRTLILDMQEI